MAEYNLDRLKSGLHDLGIELTGEQMGQFVTFYEMLVDWNTRMNLTAITDFEEVVTKHFLDSLSIVKMVDLKSAMRAGTDGDKSPFHIIDVGTGAGFPGIPLKIAYPRLFVTLMDSLNKRIGFLTAVKEELGLADIELIHSRAEDLGKSKQYRERYDLGVSRAVANLSTLSEYCLPLVKTGGCFVSYKSVQGVQELEEAAPAIRVLGGEAGKVETFTLPGTDLKRTLIGITKVRPTPKKYPRKAGVPAKEPLRP